MDSGLKFAQLFLRMFPHRSWHGFVLLVHIIPQNDLSNAVPYSLGGQGAMSS